MKRFIIFVSIIINTTLAGSAAAAVSNAIRLNSVGFLPDRVKRASILGAAAGSFTIKRALDNSTAFTGTLSAATVNADTSESLRTADFTALTETGSFYLDCALGQSPTFRIGNDVYNEVFWAEVMGFYSHRCGTAVSYVWKGQTYGHGACHLNDAYQDSIGGGHVIRDGTRGWHDAGDYGKYSVNGAFASTMLLQAWEWHAAVLSQWSFPIPESGGAIPDYLDEVKWNLDWLLKMQAADGSVYHKLTTYNFAPFIMPEADTADTQYAPAGSHATADFCGVMALAARVYAPYDAAFAAQCRTAADRAWAWLQAHPGEVLPNLAGFSTGAYNEPNTDADHRAFAAAQYWETTGNPAALADFESRLAADADLVSTYWDWGEHAYGKRGPKNHGIFTYLLSKRSGRNPARVAALQADLFAEADGIKAARDAHGYGRPLGTRYHWGSNGTVARQVMLLDCADQLSPNAGWQDTMVDALGFLFGRNSYARSFVTGVGYNPPLNPHDRMSASDGIANPVPGHLVGGAESTATSWTDTQGDYVTNEIAINWDAALVAALARFVTVPPPPTPSPTPSPTPCFSTAALLRVNVGGPQVTTGGHTWQADKAWSSGSWGYTGGAVSSNGNAIANTSDPVLYQSARYGMLSYQFSVANGDYRVELHLAETYFNTAGARVFSVTLEGVPVLSNLDVYVAAGGSNRALVLTRDVHVADGILTLGFSATVDNAEIKAIALYPAVACPATPTFTASPPWTPTPTPSRTASFTSSPTRTPSASLTPTFTASPTPCGDVVVARLNVGGGPYLDGAGNLWSADAGYTGGTAATSGNAIAGTADDALYQSERYGSPLTYAIPVPYSGTYRVRFLWAETYCTAPACRRFSVSLEGNTVISDLDLYAAAGANTAYQLTRTVVVNDATLNIVGTATLDNAKFNAIELVWLGPACASPTPTRTSPPNASPTSSPSATASRTPTPSVSPTPSPSATASRTPTPSVSPTPSPSATASRTPTPSISLTSSPSVTASRTPTPSISLTSSPSVTASRTPTPSISPTPSPSATTTAGSSLSASPTLELSRTGTKTATPALSNSATATVSWTLTPSASPTPSIPLDPTPLPSADASPGGILQIRRAVLHPNPCRGSSVSLWVDFSGPAESLRVRVYTPALSLIEEREIQQRFSEGWARVRLDLMELPPGLSYLSLQAKQGKRASPPVPPLRLFRLP